MSDGLSNREFLLAPKSRAATTSLRPSSGTTDRLDSKGTVVKKLIMIVEDDQAIVDIYKRLINAKLPDCRVVGTFSNGMGIVDYLSEQFPGKWRRETTSQIVILMDYQMPVMDGLATAKIIRSMWERSWLKIILVSGYDVPLADTAGWFDAVIRKPFRSNELLYEISRL